MRKLALSLVALALAASPALAGKYNKVIEIGQKAPDFTLAAPGGKQVKLSDLTAKGPVVLYTFIQAFTGP